MTEPSKTTTLAGTAPRLPGPNDGPQTPVAPARAAGPRRFKRHASLANAPAGPQQTYPALARVGSAPVLLAAPASGADAPAAPASAPQAPGAQSPGVASRRGRHAKWAAVGTALGIAVQLGARAAGPRLGAAVAAGMATGLTAAAPALLAAALLLRLTDAPAAADAPADGNAAATAAPDAAQVGVRRVAQAIRTFAFGPADARPAPLVPAVGMLAGLALAPVVLAGVGAITVAGPAAAATLLGAGLLVEAHRHGVRTPLRRGLGLLDGATLVAAAATLPIAWTAAAGVSLATVGAGAAATCLAGAGGVVALQLLTSSAFLLPLTPYADGHLVPAAEVAQHRADCFGEPDPTVRNVPLAVQQKLARAMRNLRRDADEAPYWLGLPVLTLEGPPGTGKTSVAYSIAEKLDADLLATSASLLGRAHLQGFPVGQVRLITLLIQAELRALRLKRLQVVFVDEASSLFPRAIDVQSPDGISELVFRAAAVFSLAQLNARRNGVMLVLAANHASRSKDALLTLSPQPPVRFGLPAPDQLRALLAQKWTQCCTELDAKWKGDLFAERSFRDAVAPLLPLAEAARTGRDVAGAVARMRQAAEAAMLAPGPRHAEAVAAEVMEAGRRAFATYGAELRRTPTPTPTPRAAPVDPEALQESLRMLVRRAVADPRGTLTTLVAQQLRASVDVRQALDRQRIFGAFAAGLATLDQRVNQSDAPSALRYLAEWWDVSRSQPMSKLWAGLPEGPEGDRRAEAMPFADVTLPVADVGWWLVGRELAKAATPSSAPRCPAEPHAARYGALSTLQGLYVMLGERFDGRRQDPYRSEWLLALAREPRSLHSAGTSPEFDEPPTFFDRCHPPRPFAREERA